MVRGLVGAHGHAAYGVEELRTVDAQYVGIVLRDDVAVLGILAHDEAADHHGIAESKYCS